MDVNEPGALDSPNTGRNKFKMHKGKGCINFTVLN